MDKLTAIRLEHEFRLESFIDAPEYIGGVEVTQFTPYHHIILDLLRNPYVAGGDTSRDSIIEFLWIVSQPSKLLTLNQRGIRHWLRRFWFARKVRKKLINNIHRDIYKYLEMSSIDRPPRMVGSNVIGEDDYVSWAAFIVYKYGHDALHTPYRQLTQLFRVAVKENDPSIPMINVYSRRLIKDE